MKVKKIVMHTDEGVQTFDCEKVAFTVERGVKQSPDPANPDVMRIERNGLSRGTLRFWAGCEKFDDFWTDTREVVR